MRCPTSPLSLAFFATCLAVQQPPPGDIDIDDAARTSVIENVISRIQAGYVIPESGQAAIRDLRSAQISHRYDGFLRAKEFAEKLTLDLRSATNDKHIAVFFAPESTKPAKSPGPRTISRERFNFGFAKIEHLRGNIGYLDLRSFANLDEGRETASTYMSALANFDAIIIDLRRNGGGNRLWWHISRAISLARTRFI